MLDKEYKYYLEHELELLKKYKNKFIVVKGDGVIGSYPTEKEAYEATVREYKLGTFLIHRCIPSEKSFPLTFHSRVVFS